MDVNVAISPLDERVQNPTGRLGIRGYQLRNKRHFPIVFRFQIAHISTTAFSMLYTYERSIITLHASEQTGVCLSVSGIGISLQRGEMNR